MKDHDLIDVWTATAVATAMHIADIQALAATLAWLAAFGFTVWKWKKAAKRKRDE